MKDKKISKSIETIRKEVDNMEEKIKPKSVTTYGDPIVEIY